jgi:hypothetical protein
MLWAMVPNQLPERRNTQQFFKAYHILKRDNDAIKVYVYKQSYPGPMPPKF